MLKMRFLIKTFLFFIPIALTSTLINKTPTNYKQNLKIASPIELIQSVWVDSLMDSMSLEEKIGQLFMVAAYTTHANNKRYVNGLIREIQKYGVGGLILMDGSPVNSANFLNMIQSNVKLPLMVAVDGEWGLGMRLDSIKPFPKAMELGAVKNDQLIFDYGKVVASQSRRLGIHINFAPVLDINTRYNNPIINMRSFGDQKINVTRKGLAFAMGMQNCGVLAVGKHFPGHGSTFQDSHKTLPIVYSTKEKLSLVDMYPFHQLIENELGGIMVAHISYPMLDARKNRPASLSSIVIDSILKKKLGFKGLVFTDALNMKGVTNNFHPGELEVQALLAGNDVLVFPENVGVAFNSILRAVKSGVIKKADIDAKCRKILKAKQWFGLDHYKPVNTNNISRNFNNEESKLLVQNIAENSLTLLKNSELLPLKELENKKLLCISLGNGNSSEFKHYLNKYMQVDTLNLSKWPTKLEIEKLMDTITYYTHIIIGQIGISEWPFSKFNLSEKNILLAEKIAGIKPVVFVFMGNPYAMRYYPDLKNFESLVIAYGDNETEQRMAAEAIFGGVGVKGILPVTINNEFQSGTGLTYSAIRLKYSIPEEFGLNENDFYRVDSIALEAIKQKAIPGCQILYAKNGKVIYNKNFGYYTYKNKKPVSDKSVYDLASLTKVVATTISLMKLYEENKIDPTAKLSVYLPELLKSDKKSMKINQILAHQSGLHAWIPFYRNTLTDKGELRPGLYSTDSTENFSIRVADHLFLRNDYFDSIYQAILDTPLYHKKKYRYSDLGFYLMAKLINQNGEPLDIYTRKNFYGPLGMSHTWFKPWRFQNYLSVVPSEDDQIFRHQVIDGFVNDPGAAMLGGVSGHAGLFSTADDLAKLGQLFLNKGTYGGDHYFLSKTLDVFNKSYFKRKGNRRALGFDKPALKKDEPGPTCKSASAESFGHSGFTGTYFWIDPKTQSIFIFLSNRTYPDQNNEKLVDENIRTNIQQIFYDVLEHK